ncbi:helix-turn-helix domain-containing protein [Gordonia sp. (in: high G+C Gram-positive bacteria)]|uniref:helix-turn-helix domain-containing protein n=1 Tax=Gordonia sp. (in: high G+C Gram-positive bacteria) TaxID=84139 RepID=UPI003C7687BD
MNTPSRRLAALIAAHHEQHGSTQTALARRIGVTPKTLIKWRSEGLHGRLPSRSVLESVAKAIEVPYRLVLDAALHDSGYFAAADEARPYAEVSADAVAALTEAGNLPRDRAHDIGRRNRIDWAAFACETIAAAAANLGGSETALSGRPGSWEAAHIQQILSSTLGDRDEFLWDHRTQPVVVTLPLATALDAVDPSFDEQYQAADYKIGRPLQEAFANASDGAENDYSIDELQRREEAVRAQLEARKAEDLAEYGARLSEAVLGRLREIVPSAVPVSVQVDASPDPYMAAADIPSDVADAIDPIERAIAEAIAATAPPSCRAAEPFEEA